MPVVVVAVLGLWLWKGGGGIFPTERAVVWQLPESRASIRSVELQVWDDGALLRREEISYPAGAGADIVEKLPLREGSYQAHVFIRREGVVAPEVHTRELRVGQEETAIISLR